MALAGFLTTAQTITGSHSDFPALLVAANFTNANANALDGTTFSNGGGNVIVYTDQTKTTRVPIEVVEFVTGGTPSVQIWAKHPTMQTGATFWVEADSVQVSQPAVTNTFGRNAVWSNYAYALHLDDASFPPSDSTGNSTFSNFGSPAPGVSGKIGDGASITNSGFNLNNPSAFSVTSGYCISFWGDISNISTWGAFFRNGTSLAIQRFSSTNNLRVFHGSSTDAVDAILEFPTGVTHKYNFCWDTSDNTFRLYRDGLEVSSVIVTASPSVGGLMTVCYENASTNVDFNLFDENKFYNGPASADRVATEYSNENTPSTFWTSSDWTAGGGITVTGVTPSYNYNSIAGAIDLTGEISVLGATPSYSYNSIAGVVGLVGEITVTGQTPQYSYNSVNSVIDLTGEINVIGSTPSYSFTAISGVIDLTPEISITGATPSYSYNAVNGNVDLSSQITVVGQTASYNYNSINGDVLLAGEILVTGQTPQFNFNAIKGSVLFAGGNDFSNITVSFADSGIGVEYKQDEITVKFKG